MLAVVVFLAACQKAQEATDHAVEEVAEVVEDVAEAVVNWDAEDLKVAKAIIEEGPAEVAAAPESATTYAVDLADSKIAWKGSKLAYSHNGTIDITAGSVSVDGAGNLVGGEFTIDMSTIKDLDIEDAEKNAKLVGHLSSADFFEVEAHPTATFTITNVDAGTGMVSGNLNLKGKTHQITFPAKVNVSDSGVTANALFSIDRTKWGVNFNSGNIFKDLVADNVIADDMALNLSLVAK